jgi:site-specific recombinase XerD
MNSDMLELRNLISGFKICCQTEGKSPKTIEWYDAFLSRFGAFLGSNRFPTRIFEIKREHIRRFIIYLQAEARVPRTDKSLSPATIQGYVRTLKVFFSWVKREGYIDISIMDGIPIPKAPTRVINTFTSDQIARLIEICHQSNGSKYRNLAIILLLLDSGLRVSELTGVNLKDLDLSDGCITVRKGKGNKGRIVPIGSLVNKVLWKYVSFYRPQPLTQKIDNLFLTENGLSLTKSGVQQMLRRFGRHARISGVRCSPHTFRHTFAKNYLLNGGDIFSLQKILGHSSMASVRMYLNLFAVDIKRQHQRFSPVDNMSEDRYFCSLIRGKLSG